MNTFDEVSHAARWDAAHWVAHGVASVPQRHKDAAVKGVIAGLLRLLPPAPEGRRAVFDPRLWSEVR
ncbi:hypothetical protein ACFFG2_13905 [Paraburkholderia solisilvae]|uniref:Uncharacterized protein n=1 Tax=Paraburkholderia solisilvae TaxID=624376 RepID=A0A6J5EZS4_9BURK|nr:hypothetical protein [Paraburkholderia solisilvae]CAB3770525.1 hypothetical protein LMG29739_05809 [Paraburkholderia solisilvae]